KTVLGIPRALGSREPVLIEAQGTRHVIHAETDPAGNTHIDHRTEPVAPRPGTRITVAFPADDQEIELRWWVRGFALFNPHAVVKILVSDRAAKLANRPSAQTGRRGNFYRPSVVFPGGWRKFLPTDLTSPWWYDRRAMDKLIYQHIGAAKA